MAGLLDLADDPASQGLLSLGLRLMSTPGNFMSALGQSGLGAMGDLNAATQAKQRRDILAQEEKNRAVQMQMLQAQLQQQQEAQARQKAIEGAYRGAMRSPEQQAMGQFGGPTNAAAQAAPGMVPQVDQAQLIRGLTQADPIAAYQMLQPKQKKLSKLEPMRGPDGKMVNVAVYEDGTTSVLPFGVRPDIALQNLGNRVAAIDKNDTSGGQSFAMGQSPDSVASNAMTMRGQNMSANTAAQRLAFDATQGAGTAPKLTATQERVEAEKAKAGRQSEQMMSAMTQARQLLAAGPTASGVGAAVDWAGRQVGASTDSAKTAAQLETLSGWMVANVPRMEGPQSNFDIQNYQVMAAKVGDRTVPVAERLAALDTLEGLHRSYAQINGTPLPAAPKAPKLNIEQVYRDADRIINGGR